MNCRHCGGPVGHNGKYAHGGEVEDVVSDEYEFEPSGPKEHEENEFEEYPESDQHQAAREHRYDAFVDAIRNRPRMAMGGRVERHEDPEPESEVREVDSEEKKEEMVPDLVRKQREKYGWRNRR